MLAYFIALCHFNIKSASPVTPPSVYVVLGEGVYSVSLCVSDILSRIWKNLKVSSQGRK